MSEEKKGFFNSLSAGAPLFPLLVLFGLNAVDELDRTAFNILVPNIRDAFHLNIQGVVTLSSLVGLAVVFLEIPLSFYADRANRVRIAVIGAAAWAFFSFLTGLAGTLFLLGVARAGAGIGRSVNNPTHNSLLSDYYDVTVRTNVFSFYRAANAVGQFSGPLLAGVIAYFLGYKWAFYLLAIPTVVFVVIGTR